MLLQQNLPLGVACEKAETDGTERCGLSAVYCCSGVDPVSITIPEDWPPTQSESLAVLPVGMPEITTPDTVARGQQDMVPSANNPPRPSDGIDSASLIDRTSNDSSSRSKAWVAGVSVGAVVVALFTSFVGLRYDRKRRRNKRRNKHKDEEITSLNKYQDGVTVDKICTRTDSSGGLILPPTIAHMPQMWARSHDATPVLDAASTRSSPSKVSHDSLLHQHSIGKGSALLKFGSGMSGISSIIDNPGSSDIPAGTPAASTPRRIIEWDSNTGENSECVINIRVPISDFQVPNVSSRQEEAQHRQSDAAVMNDGGDNILLTTLLLMEQKASTAPHLSAVPSNMVTAQNEESRDEATYGAAFAPWQVRRSRSWNGAVSELRSLDSIPYNFRRRKSESQLLQALPPMTSLPPPVLPNAGPLPDVDLDVDYDAEIRPYLGQCLGTGGFGVVYEATWRGRRVAVKKLPQMGPDQPFTQQLYDGLLGEIQLASKFDCNRLVRVYGACTRDRFNVCLIMELLEGGNLFQRIYDRKKRRMSYLEILQLAHDMAAGLAYLHPSVVHRDLKPQNVLLDGEGRAKLADFGISRVKDPTKSYLSVTNDNGTPLYMAPEQFNGSRVDEKVDVFSLGVILNECYTRRQPWKDSSHFFQIILKVAIHGERPWLDPDCPAPLCKLITKCWHQDPHVRPSPAEIMRLTEFMIQDELQRWEQLASLQRGAAGGPLHAAINRLPSAPIGWSEGASTRSSTTASARTTAENTAPSVYGTATATAQGAEPSSREAVPEGQPRSGDAPGESGVHRGCALPLGSRPMDGAGSPASGVQPEERRERGAAKRQPGLPSRGAVLARVSATDTVTLEELRVQPEVYRPGDAVATGDGAACWEWMW